MENFNLSDNLNLSLGLNGSYSIFMDLEHFNLNNSSMQTLSNQPTSAMSNSYRSLSLFTDLKYKSNSHFVFKLDYDWDSQLLLGFLENEEKIKYLNLRDFYFQSKLLNDDYNIWIGLRSFKFSSIDLFNLKNPFDQIELLGGGIENEKFQASVSLNINNFKSPQEKYLATIFLSGKLLLTSGRMFEPIFAFRTFFNVNKTSQNLNQQNTSVPQNAYSEFIVGGIFSRPILNGILGTTTVWFSSLLNHSLTEYTPDNEVFQNLQNFNFHSANNTIGILDESHFYINSKYVIYSGIFATENKYDSQLPILNNNFKTELLAPLSDNTTNSNYRISLVTEPMIFLNKFLSTGINVNINYVSLKIFSDDANSIVISPFIKWTYDDAFETHNYAFFSISEGLYDWKIIKFNNNIQKNNYLSAQLGTKFEL